MATEINNGDYRLGAIGSNCGRSIGILKQRVNELSERQAIMRQRYVAAGET